MLHYWNSKERKPVNAVRASEISAALEEEFSKNSWREAAKRAMIRFLANGGEVEKIRPVRANAVTIRRGKGGYVD